MGTAVHGTRVELNSVLGPPSVKEAEGSKDLIPPRATAVSPPGGFGPSPAPRGMPPTHFSEPLPGKVADPPQPSGGCSANSRHATRLTAASTSRAGRASEITPDAVSSAEAARDAHKSRLCVGESCSPVPGVHLVRAVDGWNTLAASPEPTEASGGKDRLGGANEPELHDSKGGPLTRRGSWQGPNSRETDDSLSRLPPSCITVAESDKSGSFTRQSDGGAFPLSRSEGLDCLSGQRPSGGASKHGAVAIERSQSNSYAPRKSEKGTPDGSAAPAAKGPFDPFKGFRRLRRTFSSPDGAIPVQGPVLLTTDRRTISTLPEEFSEGTASLCGPADAYPKERCSDGVTTSLPHEASGLQSKQRVRSRSKGAAPDAGEMMRNLFKKPGAMGLFQKRRIVAPAPASRSPEESSPPPSDGSGNQSTFFLGDSARPASTAYAGYLRLTPEQVSSMPVVYQTLALPQKVPLVTCEAAPLPLPVDPQARPEQGSAMLADPAVPRSHGRSTQPALGQGPGLSKAHVGPTVGPGQQRQQWKSMGKGAAGAMAKLLDFQRVKAWAREVFPQETQDVLLAVLVLVALLSLFLGKITAMAATLCVGLLASRALADPPSPRKRKQKSSETEAAAARPSVASDAQAQFTESVPRGSAGLAPVASSPRAAAAASPDPEALRRQRQIQQIMQYSKTTDPLARSVLEGLLSREGRVKGRR